MQLASDSFADGAWIPARNAFGLPDPDSHIVFGPNQNPHLAWRDVPQGAASFVLTCIDADAPTVPDDVNQEGREVPFDLPRAEFVHWVLVDVPADRRDLAEGTFSRDVTPRGKDGSTPFGRSGVNDYTAWFSGDADMDGTYLGYDGPCPPWNDQRTHRYTFTVAALDVAELPVAGAFTVPDARLAMVGHMLGEASIIGTYRINPTARL